MPHLVPLVSIPVTRNGKRVIPPVGMAFEFSDEEAKFLNDTVVRPAHSGDARGLATEAISGKQVVRTSKKSDAALAALTNAANALAAAAGAPAETKADKPARVSRKKSDDEDL